MSAAPPPPPESAAVSAVGGGGSDKVLAAAQHIVKSLATSKNAADDMIRILSGFDNRLSSITTDLFPSPDLSSADSCEISSAAAFDAAEQLIQLWDATPDLGAAGLLRRRRPSPGSRRPRPPPPLARRRTPPAPLSARRSSTGGREKRRRRTGEAAGGGSAAPEGRRSSGGGAQRGEEDSIGVRRRGGGRGKLRGDGGRWGKRRGEVVRGRRGGGRHGVPRGGAPPPHGPPRRAARPHGPLVLAPPPLARVPVGPRQLLRIRRRHAGDRTRWAPGEPVRRPRPEAVDDLRAIADRMARAGYARELADAYCGIRRDLLDEYLSVLGVERLSIDEVQRVEWKQLNDKMKKWVQGVKTVVRVLLAGERRLCDQVLAVSDELREECFLESTKGCIMQILNFGDAVAVCPRSPEKLSRILDMYEALAEVIPEMKDLCLGSSGDGVISDVQAILDRLGDAVRGTLFEFGKVLQQESSRRAMMAGEIHPMTRYVMNYLRLLVVYSETLDVLLDDDGDDHNALGGSEDQDHLESMNPLGRRLLKLMSYLEANLEQKSKLYEDAALECIFSMNNLLYIVQKVKDSELGKILGDHWVRRRSGKIRQYSKSYLRISWMKALSYLRDDVHGSGSGSGSGHSSSRMSIKEKFKNFNLAFEENYRNQTIWKVPDPQLREELKISISENVIPAYRAFLGRYGGQVDGGRSSGKYIKYTPEDLEGQLSDLFEGSPGSANHSRRRT